MDICVDILSVEHPIFYVALVPGRRVTKINGFSDFVADEIGIQR
jgi:hypothetical protein